MKWFITDMDGTFLNDKESNKIIDAIKHIDSRQSSIREVFPNKDYFFVKDEKENQSHQPHWSRAMGFLNAAS